MEPSWVPYISVAALILGFLNLVWNIRSKFVFPTAKLDVVVCIDNNAPDLITFEVVNIGPIDAIVAGIVVPTKKDRWRKKHYFRLTTRKQRTFGGTPLSLDAAFPRRVSPGEIMRMELKKDKLQDIVGDTKGFGVIDTSENYYLIKREPYQSLIELLKVEK